jgi:hypothetical protein
MSDFDKKTVDKTAKDNKAKEKEWYKHGWGLVVAVLFLPYFIVWYAWAKSSWIKNIKIAVTALVAIIILPVMIAIAATDPVDTNQQDTVNNDQQSEQIEEEQATVAPEPEAKSTPEPEAEPQPAPEPEATLGEKNALSKAFEYLNYGAFSRSGLVEQLEFEGFTREEATYGADNSGADWNEQASLKAQEYMDYSSFSRDGLIEQLEFEGFTRQQAEYGAKAVGY